MNKEIEAKARAASEAARKLSAASSEIKNAALKAMASALDAGRAGILEANKKDIEAAGKKGLSQALIDRLRLDDARIDSMIEGLNSIAALNDPVGEIIEKIKRPNGLDIKKVRVPIGVIGIIYEARPNVTVDAAGLCLKAGSAVILKGGSDAINSNSAITKVISKAAQSAGLPDGCIGFIEDTDRSSVTELLSQRKYIDCIIPRGGAGLINMVVESSKIPVIETGVGNCHAYVEATADLKMAEDIVFNAKVQRPSVCNAIETLLIDEKIAKLLIPSLFKRLRGAKVELRGDEMVRAIDPSAKAASEEDWSTEFLDLILAVKIVNGVADAVAHINKYGSRHSEAIITKDPEAAKIFTSRIDAAAIYVNASTRFTDGFEFGLGAEIGISTQKLHARGPMGLKEITAYKYVVEGTGQVRQ